MIRGDPHLQNVATAVPARGPDVAWNEVPGNTVRCPHCGEPLWQKSADVIVRIRAVLGPGSRPTCAGANVIRHRTSSCRGRSEFIVHTRAG